MALSDRDLPSLADPGSTYPSVTSPAPSGWEPGVRYEPDGTRVVTLPPSPELLAEDDWTAAVTDLGIPVPDGYRVRLVEAKYDPAAWTREAPYSIHPATSVQHKTPATTRPVWRYRFVVEPAPARIDVAELLVAVRKRTRTPSPTTAGASFVFACGDLQLGKPDGDGTAGTVARFYDSLDRALARYKALRKRGLCGPVVLPWLGDCIEGTESQGSRLVSRLDLTMTEMVRVFRRLMADQVSAFSDLSDDVLVVAVPGNHDEAKRVGDKMATRYDDSWAIDGAAQVADVMAAKGREVKWLFPGIDGLHVTAEVSGTRMGFLHGHQTRGKMQPWLGGMAVNRDPIGTADVVLSGHFHHLRLEHIGPTTWMQTGALDGGSAWFTHRGNPEAPPAALTFVTEGGAWHALEVV
jgi:predicted phosphodiesterase